MVNGRQERKLRLVGVLPLPRPLVVVPADQTPIEALTGVEVQAMAVDDSLVDRITIPSTRDTLEASGAVPFEERGSLSRKPLRVDVRRNFADEKLRECSSARSHDSCGGVL